MQNDGDKSGLNGKTLVCPTDRQTERVMSSAETQAQCHIPSSGTASEVAGMVSATILRKTVRDNRIVTPVGWVIHKSLITAKRPTLEPLLYYSPRESFSPESGGKMKPNKAMEAIKTQGTIRLKK